jgi:transketolase C-terminal domain/subunit
MTLSLTGLISIGKCKNLKVLSIGDKSRPIEDVAITHLIPIMPNLEVLDIIQYEKVSTCILSRVKLINIYLARRRVREKYLDSCHQVTQIETPSDDWR